MSGHELNSYGLSEKNGKRHNYCSMCQINYRQFMIGLITQITTIFDEGNRCKRQVTNKNSSLKRDSKVYC